MLDEEETYESASIRPLMMPVVIEKRTWFIVSTRVGSIRRLAPEGTARRRRQNHEEQTRGKRKDQSQQCVPRALWELQRKTEGSRTLRTT